MAKPATKKAAPVVEETKAVAAVQPAALPVETQATRDAANQEVVASDVLIPRLLLMQGISPLVMGRKAQIGDMIRSTSSEKLGDPEHPCEVVPIRMVNSWIAFETAKSAGTQQPAFRGMIERNASNEQLPWEYEGENGEEMFRRKAITLYGLVPSDVAKYDAEIKACVADGEAPDLSRTVMPVVITFQSTSFKYAGKKCASFFNSVKVNAVRVQGLAPYMYAMRLTCREEKKGTNSWYVYDFAGERKLVSKKNTDEQNAEGRIVQTAASAWAKVLGGSSSVKVDDVGEVDENSTGGSSSAEMEV